MVIPGLVQAHLHLCQTLLRGLAEERPLLAWLRERIWRLAQHVEVHDPGVVYAAETGFLLAVDPDVVRAPGVAFVRKERVALAADAKGYFPAAPDLAVEVISPADTSASRSAARIEPSGQSEGGDGVAMLTLEEAHAFFDRQARELLEISGEEFIRRWDAGEYDAVADRSGHTDVLYLAMLRPVDRPIGR